MMKQQLEDQYNFITIVMLEDYISQLPEDDQIILREHYIPISKIVVSIRTTLSGASKTEAEVLEDAVRERCVDVPEKRIRKTISILDKAFKYGEPRMFEMTIGMKSGRLRSGICVPGSNYHYTKEYLMERAKVNQLRHFNASPSPSGFSFHTYDHLSTNKVISHIDLSTYTQMRIIELVPGVVNTNKVIYCTLLVDGYNMGSFHTAVEDDFGQCAKLSIRNTTPEFQNFLKKGMKIAIANPYYKLGKDEYYFIRMDCQANIIPIENDLNSIGSENHKLEGNKHFRAGEFSKAVSCYTKAIAIDPSNPVYLSNRALCYLKLDLFEKALQDAEAAVKLDTNTHKYRYRLAMAWSALGDHEKSLEILEEILDNSDYSTILCKEKQLLNNSRGIFDFDEMAQKTRKGEKLEIADFIGPIIIDKSHTHGYGVFATRDIKKGELVCVQKAIAYVEAKKRDPFKLSEYVYFADVIRISHGSLRMMNQSLTETIAKSKLSAFRFFMLFTKHTYSEPISIELYRSKGYELIREKDNPPFQMDALDTLIQQNTQVYSDPADSHNEEMNTAGVWPIHAFLNHSCLPNTSQTYYKDVCIIRSMVNIPKGTELTSQWVSIFLDVEERQAKLKEWDISCDCELCEFESDPRNKSLLEKAVLLRERARKLADIKSIQEYQMMHNAEYHLLNEAFALAEEMKLGPTRINIALWQAMQYLLSSTPLPGERKRLLDSFYRAKTFLCDLEVHHQRAFWDIWYKFIRMCQAPLSDECENEIREKHYFITQYLTNIP